MSGLFIYLFYDLLDCIIFSYVYLINRQQRTTECTLDFKKLYSSFIGYSCLQIKYFKTLLHCEKLSNIIGN